MKTLFFFIMCLVLHFSIANANQSYQPKQAKKKPLTSNAKINNSLVIEMRKLSKKVENNLKEQRKKQDEELALWRSQVNVKGTVSYLIAAFSFLILLVTLFIPLYLWSYRKLLPEINNAKLIFESWKNISLLLTDIQLNIMREHLEITPTGSLQIDNEPIQSYILSLDIIHVLQRLTSRDYDVVKNGCEYLVQIWAKLQQKSRSKIKLFIGEILSSGIAHSLNKKLLKKLLSDLV